MDFDRGIVLESLNGCTRAAYGFELSDPSLFGSVSESELQVVEISDELNVANVISQSSQLTLREQSSKHSEYKSTSTSTTSDSSESNTSEKAEMQSSNNKAMVLQLLQYMKDDSVTTLSNVVLESLKVESHESVENEFISASSSASTLQHNNDLLESPNAVNSIFDDNGLEKKLNALKLQISEKKMDEPKSAEQLMVESLQRLYGDLDEILDIDDDDIIMEKENIEKEEEKDVKEQDLPPPPSENEEIDALLLVSNTDALSVTKTSSVCIRTDSVNPSSSTSSSSTKKRMFAKISNLPNELYEILRPMLAIEYPFELDHFQKQAIMRLERRENVFVAAHTSAGKTVIAEYAIALANKHSTRAIYTSPIKALSNQKYRDFKEKFGADKIGLITGDVSINPDANCLIMTTEILRSMLYRGSDTIRDIEWVIFDEVHYVNDLERGVVWEEVIIMLPTIVNMIFLSATTPNTIEFCDWIGRTKQRNVYVTSTMKRPVPLQHFLLHDDEYYGLLNAETGFNTNAIAAANKHLRDKAKPKVMSAENAKMQSQRKNEKAALAAQAQGRGTAKSSGNAGPVKKASSGSTGSSSFTSSAGSKAQWLSLIRVLSKGGRKETGGLHKVDFNLGVKARYEIEYEIKMERESFEKYEKLPAEFRAMVSKRDYEKTHIRISENDVGENNMEEFGLLPVVIFCFSKKKCEEIADHLQSQDLLVAKEKGIVKIILQEMRQRLSPLDARLPQVLRMEEMAKRGLGVHHGGLLPIIKEAMEVLFGKGLIKVLIATETFAMGVNMPARSVVFNGFRKHDGKSFRDLLPGEYTQMAGRAGRRGLDKVGTVIIAAWNELPGEMTLKKLLTGTATKLSSKFRLTYSMILNLLRGNDMSVEDMIKRSFSEFHTQKHLLHFDFAKKLALYQHKLLDLDKSIESISNNVSSVETKAKAFIEMYLSNVDKSRSRLHFHLEQIMPKHSTILKSNTFCKGRVVWIYLEKENDDDIFSGIPAIIISTFVESSFPEKNAENTPPKIFMFFKNNNDGNDNNNGKIVELPLTSIVLITTDVVSLPSQISSDSEIEKKETTIELGSTKKGSSTTSTSSIESFSKMWKDSDVLAELATSLKNITEIQIAENDLHVYDINKKCGLNNLEYMESNDNVMKAYQTLHSTYSNNGNLQFIEVYLQQNVQILELYKCYGQRFYLEKQQELVKFYLNGNNLSLLPDFNQRLHLLRELDYVSSSEKDVVLLKGRVACEINTCNELLATEIIFNNILENLNPPEAAAILSSLVFQEKNQEYEKLTSRMEIAREKMLDLLDILNELQEKEGVIVDEDTKPSLNFGLAAVVYQWARGVSFHNITQMTLTQEGTIVRCITRLDEMLRDVRNAARVVGNPSLYRKMEAASQCIKRDIVFAASMYI